MAMQNGCKKVDKDERVFPERDATRGRDVTDDRQHRRSRYAKVVDK